MFAGWRWRWVMLIRAADERLLHSSSSRWRCPAGQKVLQVLGTDHIVARRVFLSHRIGRLADATHLKSMSEVVKKIQFQMFYFATICIFIYLFIYYFINGTKAIIKNKLKS
jgi:hypothetical protein